MNVPEVSVIIPAYNAGRWIGDAIRSVQAQTLSDWELIVVNDGSTDDTLQAASGFGDGRIRVIDQANKGVSAARNAGIAAALGRYLCFMDADDAMLPQNLAAKLAVLGHHGVTWVFGDLALCDGQLRPTGGVLHGTDGDVIKAILLSTHAAVPAPCSNVVAHRSCFDQGVRFDEELSNAADQDFGIQLASRFPYRHVPQALNLYRMHPGSMSTNVQLFQNDHLRMFRKARENGLLDDRQFRNTCMAKVYWAIGGSWWLLAHQRMKAVPWFIRAFLTWPGVILRPLRKRFC